MKNRAFELMESELVKLQRTLEETRDHQKRLNEFKNRAEEALNLEYVFSLPAGSFGHLFIKEFNIGHHVKSVIKMRGQFCVDPV